MSKLWKRSIPLPTWVNVTCDANHVIVRWPKWTLEHTLPEQVSLHLDEKLISLSVWSQDDFALRWLSRALVSNMVEWVSVWFSKKLLILWVWYWVKAQWKKLEFSLWFSHKVHFELPWDVDVVLEKDVKWNDIMVLSSISKHSLWSASAKIRSFKVPEPYKWKWIRYSDEIIKLKAGKTSKK